MSKDGVQVNRRTALLITAAAFLAALMGFAWLLLTLHHPGIKTRTERLYYLPYQNYQEGVIKQTEARVPLRMSVREVESGIFEHTLEVQSSSGESMSRMSELGLELSAPTEWKLISADVSFQGNEGTKKSPNFVTLEPKKQGADSSILLKALPKAQVANPRPERGLLTIKSRGTPELSVWVQKSVGKPVSEILWTTFPNTEGGAVYASLSGWFRYSEEGVPSYSRAQLLAYTWGMGVAGNRVIYTLVGIAFLLWVSGMGLILVPNLMTKVIPRFLAEAIGCSLIFGAICLIFSVIFPPFHGPDEVYHFLGYAETSGRENLASNSLEIANLGSFHRIHRIINEKFTSIDLVIENRSEWPPETANPYKPARSPLGMEIWKGVKGIINDQNAGHAMLQLRVINCFFVAAALLFALIVAGSIFPMRHLAPWISTPVILIPCIAHYSTVVSNYPFLIGGYVIQMVVLGILWEGVDSQLLSKRALVSIGMLLGLGVAIGVCSADNAIVTLPFWGVILPAFLMVRKTSNISNVVVWPKESTALLGSMFGALILFCIALAPFSINNSFLPGTTSSKLAQILPVHGSQFLAGVVLLVIYCAGICALTTLLCILESVTRKSQCRLPWRAFGIIALTLTIFALITCKVPQVPEIDLSRGGNTTALKYAITVVAAFADGLLPGQADEMICGSFWRKLGWLETDLPAGLMEFLRVSTGLGIILLIWVSLRKSSVKGLGLFTLANIFALVACLIAIGVLYGVAQYNVNSRYILVAYLFTALLAAEGYRGVFSKNNTTVSANNVIHALICIAAMSIQSWSWITILNRYF